MYLFYGDESGHSGGVDGGDQPVLVVAGILLNTHAASKTRREYRELLAELSAICDRELVELKGQELYRGRGQWMGVDHSARANARHRVLDWLADRGHRIVVSGGAYSRWDGAVDLCPELTGTSMRALLTVHIALSIQRAKYASGLAAQRKNGTLLFFDRQDRDESTAAGLIANPPGWAVGFLGGRGGADGELTVIVDTAYFVDSQQAPLIQLADFVAFMIQRQAALDEGLPESFSGEPAVVQDVFDRIKPLIIDRSHRLPRVRPATSARALALLSPTCLQ